jgi:hypothetical protein
VGADVGEVTDAPGWPPEWGAIELRPLDHSTPVTGDGAPPDATLGDFWQWAYSDLTMNTTRGVLAEYLVALAIRAREVVRDAWATYDLTSADGVTVEVKSAAHIQSWPQHGPSRISFNYAVREGLDPATQDHDRMPARHAQVYVFALLTCMDQGAVNALDVSQWEFYVVPTWWLNQRERSQESITLSSLQGSHFGTPHTFVGLANAVRDSAASRSPSERDTVQP